MRVFLLSSALALTAACSGDGPSFELESFESCDALSAHMARMARQEIAWNYRPGPIGFTAEFDMTSEQAGGFAPRDAGNDGAEEFSGTNTQEQGVDEADLVKTDGTYLYAISGKQVVITRAWPLEDAAQLATVPLDGYPQGIYLVEDTLVALSQTYWEAPSPRAGDTGLPGAQYTVMTVVDVAEPANPVVLREAYTQGELKESRRIDNKLYVVSYNDVRLDLGGGTRRDQRIAVDTALPEAWLPERFDNIAQGDDWNSVTEPACGCDQTWAAPLEGGTFMTTVQLLDVSDPTGPIDGGAIVGRADMVYASTKGLYVSYSSWDDGPFGGWSNSGDSTIVHKFDLESESPTYLASGRVPGRLPDQFGMSERNGVLSLATTDWSGEPSSGVYTLEEDAGKFTRLGELTGLAPGESLTAARFVGDIGYLVTYEVQWGDPLFTLDMSDASNPRYGGELHVPGFSSYLHPIADDKLLSVGMTDESGRWQLQASLFDVGDLADPQLAERVILDATGSEANNEHHAFNYFPPTESLTIPSWTNSNQSVLEVLHATPTELSSVGRVNQPAAFMAGGEEWCSGVQRSVVMDGYVWAISGAGMTAADIEDPGQTVAGVDFTGVSPCDRFDGWW